MDVFDAVRTVLAVRRYDGRPVPDDVLVRIAEAGRLTASSMNGQPWHFVVVTEPGDLRAIAGAIRSGPYVADAPAAIAVAVQAAGRFGVSDGSRAVQSMILAAWDEGVGSNWVGFRGMEEVRSLLEVPDDYEMLAVIPLGYPAEQHTGGVKNRKPLGEVASRGRFGTPLASPDASG